MADDTPNPVGRPSEYRIEFCEKAANLCIAGATDFEVAQALDVHVSTLYRWKAEYPEFCESMRVGKDLSDDRAVASLYHRAVGYSYNAVKILQYEGRAVIVPYVEHVPPDPGSLAMWLTNRRRDEWKARQSLEHSGPNGGPIQTQNANDLTDTELAAIAGAGRAAPAEPEKGAA